MARTCKFGKLKNPTKRRKCKKKPRGMRGASYNVPQLAGARRRRKRR